MDLAEDIIWGAERIAERVGRKSRQIYVWAERRRVDPSAPPIFVEGHEVFARASELDRHFSAAGRSPRAS